MKLLLDEPVSLVVRAFQLARTGYFATSHEIKKQLKQEGYPHGLVDEHLRGQAIKTKIKSLCQEAKANLGTSRKPDKGNG